MPLFKVTEKKLEECLGEPYHEYCHPWKSKRLRYLEGFLIGGGLLLGVLLYFSIYIPYDKAYSATIIKAAIPITLILMGLTSIITYLLLRHQFFQEITTKMKEVVNDPELRWLNFHEKAPHAPTEKPMKFERYTYPFGEEAFYALSYLKRQKTDYGMEWKTWKDNRSARKLLGSLAKKKIISEQGGDYRYEDWHFRIINPCGRFLEGPEYAKKEALLDKAWEKMMEEEGS